MRILHFEYSDFFRRVVHDMALRQGYDYVDSRDGKDLFKMLSKHDFDVILTGMELADMRVEELLSELDNSKYRDLPVVIITSTEVNNIHTRLKHLKFNDFILKESLNVDVLDKCLKRIMSLKN